MYPNKQPNNPSTAAIIVVYRPDIALLKCLIAATRPQVDALWIVNNGSANELTQIDATSYQAELVQFTSNLGIGAAINYAVERAQREGYEFLLSMDQDSIPAPDMLHCLHQGYRKLTAHGLHVAAVGPDLFDWRLNERHPFTVPIKNFVLKRRHIHPKNSGCIEADYLITSGMLAPLATYKKVGELRSDFFIDYVDIEWSLRARQMGLCLYAVGGACMQHSMGDHFKVFLGKKIIIHSPLRNYYQTRNRIFLQKLKTVSFVWRASDGFEFFIKFILKNIFFIFLLPDGRVRIRMMLRGIRDGLRGKLGIFQERP